MPDFIVELKSKHDRMEDLKLKMKEWVENGCRLAWLIDVDKQVIYIYENGEVRTHKDFSKSLIAGPILPGFRLNLVALKKIA